MEKRLTIDDIYLLLTLKWISPIICSIENLMTDSIDIFIKSIETLVQKYDNTLTDIDKNIKETEESLYEILGDLTGSEFDMKGLDDFKSLIIGD